MNALCSGDYDAAGAGIHGGADLGMEGKPASKVNRVFWDAYLESLDYELVGPLYAAQTGVVQDVKLTSLDLSETTKNMGIRAQKLLTDAVEQAEDISQVYDQNNSYQAQFVEAVMEQAAREALQKDASYTSQILSIRLKYSDDQWWIVADEAFLGAISGTTAGGEGSLYDAQ